MNYRVEGALNKMALVSLLDMEPHRNGRIVEIRGGHRLAERLEAMGIRPGVEILKVTSQPMHGPIIIQVGNTQAALGCGMAARIMVMKKGD
jgi:ferrous iron transport protein A